MIVVVGSCHDPVAAALVRDWPQAALCSAQDLTQAGWLWRAPETLPGAGRWVVQGKVLTDADVTGVFVRRSTVYAQELQSTHAEDRSYLASELHAFLVFVLASTQARVANPVAEGAMGDQALRQERWLPAAHRHGLKVATLRCVQGRGLSRRWLPQRLDAVGGQVFGPAPERIQRATQGVMHELGLSWASFIFDAAWQLRTVTSALVPGAESAHALGQLLAQPQRRAVAL